MEIFDLLEDYLVDQDDGLKKLLTWFLNLVMQLEAIQQSGAEPYERNDTRTTQRNGYKERSLKTRVGDLELKKPQFRDLSFKSCVFNKNVLGERGSSLQLAIRALSSPTTMKYGYVGFCDTKFREPRHHLKS